MLDNTKIEQFFWLFGLVFPIPQDSKKKAQFDALVGGKIEKMQYMKFSLKLRSAWVLFSGSIHPILPARQILKCCRMSMDIIRTKY